ncbi:sigma-70 family RNA polymerase sigma factor [Salinispirillum sp. LH 10-3-1]|uniref:Sigma-70 family RNA polymerase sigma factor n=1 Tax=Salinispirillum sp. LH 10-3-1 TaxID=2952525 RepID=A0AB38YG44_9GAMM
MRDKTVAIRNKTAGVGTQPSSHAPELALLLYRMKQRDHAALKRLYELTSARLMAVIMRILNDEGESADVLQDLYLKLWQRPEKYVPSGSAWGWLCVVARHAALDQLKHRQRRREDALVDVEQVLQALAGPAEAFSLPEVGVDRCMARLAEEPRRAIVLSYVHGYSHQELVAVMQRPLGTIKSWVRRGLQELKQCLQS